MTLFMFFVCVIGCCSRCLGFTILLVLTTDDGPLLMCAYSDWKSTPKSHNLVNVVITTVGIKRLYWSALFLLFRECNTRLESPSTNIAQVHLAAEF